MTGVRSQQAMTDMYGQVEAWLRPRFGRTIEDRLLRRHPEQGPQRSFKLIRAVCPKRFDEVLLDVERCLFGLVEHLPACFGELDHVTATVLFGGAAGDDAGPLERVEERDHRCAVHAKYRCHVLLRPGLTARDHSERAEVAAGEPQWRERGIGALFQDEVRVLEQITEDLVVPANRSSFGRTVV